MKLTHKLFLTIFILFFALAQNSFSQVVKGTVEDGDGQKIVDAYVILVIIDDNEIVDLIGWQEVNAEGKYQFNGHRTKVSWLVGFPNDPLDYVPTFYPSGLDWSEAIAIQPNQPYTSAVITMQECESVDNFSGNSIPLSGTVINREYLKALLDAAIIVKRNNELISYIRTDFNGSFEMELSSGDYEISATKFGFQKETKFITVGEKNSNISLNFELASASVNSNQNFVFPTLAELRSGKYENRNLNVEIRNFNLSQNYPNPFNPVTNINFDIPETGNVKLNVYDLSGKEIATLVNEYKAAGNYSVSFDASNLSTGVYIYKLTSNHQTVVKRMLLIK
jgi:hypothetical protein